MGYEGTNLTGRGFSVNRSLAGVALLILLPYVVIRVDASDRTIQPSVLFHILAAECRELPKK